MSDKQADDLQADDLEWRDLGGGYSYQWLGYHPSRTTNEINLVHHMNSPDIDRAIVHVVCPHGENFLHVNKPEVTRVFKLIYYFTVTSEEPLNIIELIERKLCGCKGYIFNGKWVPSNG